MYTHASESSRLLATDSRWSLANQNISPSPLLSSADSVTLQDILFKHSRSACDHEDTISTELDAKFEEVSLISPYPNSLKNSPAAHRSSLGHGLPSAMRLPNSVKCTPSFYRHCSSSSSALILLHTGLSQSSARLRHGSTDARSPTFWESPSPIINEHTAINRPFSSRRIVSSPLTSLAYWRKLIGFAFCGSTENSPDSTQGMWPWDRLMSKHSYEKSVASRASSAGYVELQHHVDPKNASPEDRPSSIDIPVYYARRPSSRRTPHTRQRNIHRQARRTSRCTSRSIACSPPRQDELDWQAQYCVSPESTITRLPRLAGLGFYAGIAPDFDSQGPDISLNQSRRQLEAKRQVHGEAWDVLF